eukprot:gene1509-1644_t
MSASDEDLFGTMLRIENKDIFVDLRRNASGTYLKLSERKGTLRKTVLIPASGIARLQAVLEEVSKNSAVAQLSKRGRILDEKSSYIADPANPVRSVYVSGLPWSTTDAELATYFGRAGKVVKATILKKTRRGKVVSVGCGVVEYSNVAEAARAIAQFDGTELGGRSISCREDRKVQEDSSDELERSPIDAKAGRVLVPNKVFVKSLSWDTTDASLLQFFSQAGRVLTAAVKMNARGRSTGSGVVEFADVNSATNAIVLLNERELDGRKISVKEYYD